jgi:hypothetical protein
VLEAFIAKYADTLYGPIARGRLEQLKSSRVPVTPPPGPSRQPVPVAPATLPSSADQRYGTIAYSPATGTQGWAHDYNSKDAAEAAAITNCRLQANDCSVPVSFRNGCGALAVGSTNFGSGWGADRKTPIATRRRPRRPSGSRARRRAASSPSSSASGIGRSIGYETAHPPQLLLQQAHELAMVRRRLTGRDRLVRPAHHFGCRVGQLPSCQILDACQRQLGWRNIPPQASMSSSRGLGRFRGARGAPRF